MELLNVKLAVHIVTIVRYIQWPLCGACNDHWTLHDSWHSDTHTLISPYSMSSIPFLYKTELRQLTKLQLLSYLQRAAVPVFINGKTVKTNGGVDVELHTFLTSALTWTNCQPPASPLYRLGKRHPIWTEGSFALESVLTFRRRETCCCLPEMTPDLPGELMQFVHH